MNTLHKIAVIGLGYVGLPLARLFATKYPVVGFDINQKRIGDISYSNSQPKYIRIYGMGSCTSSNPIT